VTSSTIWKPGVNVTRRVNAAGLSVANELFDFVQDEALPGTGLDEASFWLGAAAVIAEFRPQVSEMLSRRAELQTAIDSYAAGPMAASHDPAGWERFLRQIAYLVDEPDSVTISTTSVDAEIARIPGPQLVVPLVNARFAVNAANARWGSLYDALYGTDAIDETEGRERTAGYNRTRGAAVIAWARSFLDSHFPLASGSHADAVRYSVRDGELDVETADSTATRLAEPGHFIGFQGASNQPTAVVLRHHELHVEIQFDPSDPVGASDRAGVRDVVLESAVTTIMDLEDSVAAVDVSDKVGGYRNWLHLMQRRLQAPVIKGERTFIRRMADDRTYAAPSGEQLVLPGRALLLIRQVGHLMTSDAVLDANGDEVPEGILDALIIGLGSLHDLRGAHAAGNSRTGSMYVVKPKMHGPDEVALTCAILAEVERILGMPPLTIKIGIMDEERRTSANLKACIYQARDRIVFINTGFLDRTGDEIHTSMETGSMVRKADMQQQAWITAYEDANVDIGLECGFHGRAQIGKGMWAAPDNMADMLRQKIGHPKSGANCAWVPSPTAATLHATHYHAVDVMARQRSLSGRRRSTLSQLLTLPIGDPSSWDNDTRQEELDNNIQSILGYVVRWVNAGVGCSKVPDLRGTPLMEDRATCRISSQHVANWLRHHVVRADQVEDSLRRIAVLVDDQNKHDSEYRPMSPDFTSEAFLAARDLVLDGAAQPSGYTEPILHRHRLAEKRHLAESLLDGS